MKKIFEFRHELKIPKWCFAVLGFFCLIFSLFCIQEVWASPAEELKDDLRQQIDELQSQINDYRQNIKDLQQQGRTLKRDVALLNSKIKTAELEIKQTGLAIKQTEEEISGKNLELGQAELKIGRERKILGDYLRLINDYDQQNLIEAFLSDDKLSDIFERVSSLESIQREIQESMEQIKEFKAVLQADKQVLEDRRGELNQLKVLQQIQRQAVAAQQADKNNLLAQTNGQESTFQKLLVKAQADAASIRKSLYLLEGVGLSMSLEQAYQYAKKASDLTGVRPAFLLAVLKKESSWGEKVGTGTWRQDMHSRDKTAFVQICEKLGLNPDTTPVSKKPSYGWGGAMGPAQFLPSVWLQYEDRVRQLTGHDPPDPWNIEDAFVAAGVKLAHGGANARTENAEWKAAQIYFAGSRWNNPTYYFYGDQVMDLAGVIQEQLNIIIR
ncbi:lytic murein transglycosylase [Patescibacteria group bacterium]|nr:lytic murein transglycosylase [Patescibacteria group bacterium]